MFIGGCDILPVALSHTSSVHKLPSTGFKNDISAPLSGLVKTGSFATTRILYPFPKATFAGNVTVIEPDVEDETEPMFTEFAKLPFEELSCAVKMLFALKELETV